MLKASIKAIVTIAFVISGLLVALVFDDQEVLIESAESKTLSGGSVYNKIKWISKGSHDIWMMNQSHYGRNAGLHDWERLAIVIDKTKSPKTAKFYQLGPGQLNWTEKVPRRPYKVSCYMCHSNGLRVIRPKTESTLSQLSIWNKLKIQYWNLKIKAYGRVVPHPDHLSEDPDLKIPFRLSSSFENEALNVSSCTICHKDEGLFARGTLRRQNFLSIRFMVSNGHMPPLGFTISKEDRAKIRRFLRMN